MKWHCLVTLRNGDLFSTGGMPGYLKKSFRYNKHDNVWEQKADMSNSRYDHGCGRMTNPTTGKEEVVVVGGTVGGNNGTLTEIYTVEDDTWRQGTPLPKALVGLASLPYEDSFLILGGYDGTRQTFCQAHKSIYQVKSMFYT